MSVASEQDGLRIRESARGIVFNEAGELLMFRCEDAAPVDPRYPDMLRYWATPGGGIKEGETPQQALRRELYEETGLTEITIGPWIWTRDVVLALPEKGTLRSYERYHLCQATTGPLTRERMTDSEAKVIQDAAWWSLEELADSREIFRPPGLLDLLRRLRSEGPPAEPIMIAG